MAVYPYHRSFSLTTANQYIFIPDIDECFEGKHGCQQVCENTLGGHICKCFVGYGGSENGCSGKV